MATKKKTAPKRPKDSAPDGAASPSGSVADPGDATVTRIHEAGVRLIEPGEPGVATQSMTRAEPDAASADAAAAEAPETSLAGTIARALRFADKEHALVRLTPSLVSGGGAAGSVFAPWNVPTLPPEGVVVDGRKLYRCLRVLRSDAAELTVLSGGARLQVKLGDRRFTLATITGADLNLITPPAHGDAAYRVFAPAAFRRALAFTGDDKVEPRDISGVNVSIGGCIATDRRSAIAVLNATDDTGITVTIPRNTFDGIEAPAVWFALTNNGHAVVGDPTTGEYRVVVAYGSAFPNVRGVLERMNAASWVTVDKPAIVDALKQFRVVQSAGSSVKINIWTAAPEGAPPADFIELRGGDPGNLADFVIRLPCKIHRQTVSPDRAMFRTCVALDALLKLAAAYPSDDLALGIGMTERDPVICEVPGLYKAAVMPMVE